MAELQLNLSRPHLLSRPPGHHLSLPAHHTRHTRTAESSRAAAAAQITCDEECTLPEARMHCPELAAECRGRFTDGLLVCSRPAAARSSHGQRQLGRWRCSGYSQRAAAAAAQAHRAHGAAQGEALLGSTAPLCVCECAGNWPRGSPAAAQHAPRVARAGPRHAGQAGRHCQGQGGPRALHAVPHWPGGLRAGHRAAPAAGESCPDSSLVAGC
jgi:hypothetical protein